MFGQHAAHPLLGRLEPMAAIARQRLVRTIAGKRHGYRFARQRGDLVGRQRTAVGEGFVEMVDQRVDQAEIIGPDDLRMVIGREAPRHRFRISALVVPLLVEADRAGLNRGLARLRHQRDDRRTVDPAGQEGTQRHVRHHAAAYPVAHPVEQFLAQRLRRSGRAIGEGDVPPLPGSRHALPALHEHAMPGGQLAHAGDEAGVVGDVAVGEIILERGHVGRAAQQRVGEQALQFGCERKAAIGQLDIV